MALVSSGSISLGGSTSGRSINLELDRAATAQISLNDTIARDLAGVASGTISLSNFYGKSSFSGVILDNLLIVAGGGGGGRDFGTGGGAGGVLSYTNLTINPGTYTITVGAGGPGALNTMGSAVYGGDSSAFGYTASAGGPGGIYRNAPSNNGGSGGGGASKLTGGTPNPNPGGSGTSGQGNDGGAGFWFVPRRSYERYCGGGGGGVSGTGTDGSNVPTNTGTGGNGGLGADTTLTGSTINYAAGGAGSGTDSVGAPGGSSAGIANRTNSVNGGDAAANSGSGGGGAGFGGSSMRGGNGGSGMVIIKYPISFPAPTAISGAVDHSTATHRIYRFTGTGSITW